MEEKKKEYNILCLGLGVQTTALAMAFENNELGYRPDVAIFCDTHAEPDYVYKNLERMKDILSYPVHVVDAGNLIQACMKVKFPDDGPGQAFPIIPLYYKGQNNQTRMCTRSCTLKFKVRAMRRGARKYFGLPTRGGSSVQINLMLGISTDEPDRMRDTGLELFKHKYPLIEELNWSREDCLGYTRFLGLENFGQSSCVVCPFTRDIQWLELKEKHPEDFERACEIDMAIREIYKNRIQLFVHSSLRPLYLCNFKSNNHDEHKWSEECMGVCGI